MLSKLLIQDFEQLILIASKDHLYKTGLWMSTSELSSNDIYRQNVLAIGIRLHNLVYGKLCSIENSWYSSLLKYHLDNAYTNDSVKTKIIIFNLSCDVQYDIQKFFYVNSKIIPIERKESLNFDIHSRK